MNGSRKPEKCGGRRGLPIWQCLVAVGLVLAPTAITAATSPTPACSMAPITYVVIGPLVAAKGSKATFSVDSVERSDASRRFYGVIPVPAREHRVVVRYGSGRLKYLAIGYRYRVELYWTGSEFHSDVPVPGRECQGVRTTYSDMREIVIRAAPRTWVRPVAIASAVGAGAVIAGLVGRRTRRARRLRAA